MCSVRVHFARPLFDLQYAKWASDIFVLVFLVAFLSSECFLSVFCLSLGIVLDATHGVYYTRGQIEGEAVPAFAPVCSHWKEIKLIDWRHETGRQYTHGNIRAHACATFVLHARQTFVQERLEGCANVRNFRVMNRIVPCLIRSSNLIATIDGCE